MTVIVAALGWSWLDAKVDPLTGAVSASPRDRGAGRSDLAALEHALRLAERWQAQVVAATVGPDEADAMLRDALAAGAAEALRVEPASRTPGLRPALLVGGPDAAGALAAALIQRYGVPDLVLCGDRSPDRGNGSFPAFLAGALDAAQALGVVRIEPTDDGKLRVHRPRWRPPRGTAGAAARRGVGRGGRGAAAVGRAGPRWPAGTPSFRWPPPRRPSPGHGSGSLAPTRTGPGRASSRSVRFSAAPDAGANRSTHGTHPAHGARPAARGPGRRRTARYLRRRGYLAASDPA